MYLGFAFHVFLGSEAFRRASSVTGVHKASFFFSSRRRHTRFKCDWSSDVCSSDLSKDQKYIGVSLYQANSRVNLEVRDRGIGIPANEQEKIFEKFYRCGDPLVHNIKEIGRASCRERV